MPQIRPLADLQDKLNDIYEVIHQTDQPMFFTRDGENDVVIMSFDTYNRNLNTTVIPDENQSYVKTLTPNIEISSEEQVVSGIQSSEEILNEARRKLQDMVDEYSYDCNASYLKNKKKKNR